MATIRTTQTQNKEIAKVNAALAELAELNIICAANYKGTVTVGYDLGIPRGGRAKGNKEYTVVLEDGRAKNAVMGLVEARRTKLRKEVKASQEKNRLWLSLSKKEQAILRGEVVKKLSDDAGDDTDDEGIEDTPADVEATAEGTEETLGTDAEVEDEPTTQAELDDDDDAEAEVPASASDTDEDNDSPDDDEPASGQLTMDGGSEEAPF